MADRCLCSCAVLLFAAALTARPARAEVTASALAGRWEGTAQTAGPPIVIVLDLAKTGGGAWAGSAIFPQFGVKGAPLKDLSIDATALACTVKGALAEPKFTAKLAGDGTLSGSFEYGGHNLHLSLKRAGEPQVDLPRPSTAIQEQLEGNWQGTLDLGGFKMRLGLELANGDRGFATGKLIMLDSGNYTAPIELIAQNGDSFELAIPAVSFGYEGSFDKHSGEVRGVLWAGPLQIPLAWRRTAQ